MLKICTSMAIISSMITGITLTVSDANVLAVILAVRTVTPPQDGGAICDSQLGANEGVTLLR